MLCNKRSHSDEQLHSAATEQPSLVTTRESPHSNEDPAQPKNKLIFFKKDNGWNSWVLDGGTIITINFLILMVIYVTLDNTFSLGNTH